MDRKKFQSWLAGVDNLSHAQRTEASAVLSGQPDSVLSLAAIEASVEEDRRCPHCGTPGAVSRGKARGLRRYQCKGCKRTFNAATGTPLSGLHRKERWLTFDMSLAEGEKPRSRPLPSRLATRSSPSSLPTFWTPVGRKPSSSSSYSKKK